jgi:hypothetical protein
MDYQDYLDDPFLKEMSHIEFTDYLERIGEYDNFITWMLEKHSEPKDLPPIDFSVTCDCEARKCDCTINCFPCGIEGVLPSKEKHHVGNGKHKGIFAGTLNMAPTWPENEVTLINAIQRIMKQKTCPVKRLHWNLEYTKANLPHIHFMYETVTGGRIHSKVFQRCYHHWDESKKCGEGHQGGYHREVYSEEEYMEYIKKDNGRHGSMG